MNDLFNTIAQKTQQLFNPVIQGGEKLVSQIGSDFNNFVQQQPTHAPNLGLMNQFHQEFQNWTPPVMPIGLNLNTNPINNLLADAPSFLQQHVQQPINNFIDRNVGNNFAGNTLKDITNIGTGIASLPGIGAQATQSPQAAGSIASSLIGGLINNYKSDVGFDQNGNWNLSNIGSNFYNRPVSTILDALPVLGMVGKLGELGKAGEAANVAEKALSPIEIQKYGSDLKTPEAQGQLSNILQQAQQQKPQLDDALSQIAQSNNSDFASRIKEPDTLLEKVITHRIQGNNDYTINNVNDVYGGRIIVRSNKDIPGIVNQIKDLQEQGVLQVLKDENVKNETYSARHLDVESNGVPGEIQIMNQKQAAESLVNHGIRSVAGEEPQGVLAAIRDNNADAVKGMSNDEAGDLTGQLTTDQANATRVNMIPNKDTVLDSLNYPQKMRDLGFNQDEIDQTSPIKAQAIFQNGTKPGSTAMDLYKTWVNDRAASPIEGMSMKKNFNQYDKEGIEGIIKFQENPTQYTDVKDYFDNKYQDIRDAGIYLGYKENYLPQLWKNSPEEINQAYGRNLNPKTAKFSFESLLQNYKQGLAVGLTPRFNTLSDLVGWYEGTANKLLADNSFYNKLKAQGSLTDMDSAPYGYQNINGTQYAASPEVAKTINNYLNTPDDLLSKVANVNSSMKNIALSTGIPGTGINWHGFTTLARNTLFSNNPISGFLKGSSYLLNPKLAQTYIDNNLSLASEAVHQGLNLNIEDHNYFSDKLAANLKNPLAKAYSYQEHVFSDPLFKQVIPALKLQYYSWLKDNLDPQQAAAVSNHVFGGENLDALARSKVTQNVLRSVLFAPDFAETNLGIGKGVAKALLDPMNPASKPYTTFVRNFLMSYVALNAANYLASGHLAINNDPGHQFDIDAGDTSDGSKRFVSPYASGVDFLKIPVDLAAGLLKGDSSTISHTIQNRIAPIPADALHQFTGTNYLGQKLYKPGSSLPNQMIGRGLDVANSMVPPQLTNTAKYLSGNQGLEQSISAGIQAPIRYSGGASTQAEQAQVDLMKSGGASGQEINQSLQQVKQASQAKPQTQSFLDSLWSSLGIPKKDPSQTGINQSTGDPLLDALNNKKNIDTQTKTIKDIFSSGMTPDEIKQALNSKGIDYNVARTTMLLSLNDSERAPIVKTMLSQATDKTSYESMVGELGRSNVLTSGIVSEWLRTGEITTFQAAGLNNAIKLSKNESVKGYSTYTGTTGSSGYGSYGSGSNSRYGRNLYPQRPSVPSMKAPSFNLNFPNLAPAKLQAFPKIGTQTTNPNIQASIEGASPSNPYASGSLIKAPKQQFNLKMPGAKTIG